MWIYVPVSISLDASESTKRGEGGGGGAVKQTWSSPHSALHSRKAKYDNKFLGWSPCLLGSSCHWMPFVFVYYCALAAYWLLLRSAAHIWQLVQNKAHRGRRKAESSVLTLAARVMLRSFITSSNAAVSSACFWLCKAIFSLNFRGLFEVAMFPSSAPFFPHWSSYRESWRVSFRPVIRNEPKKIKHPFLLFCHFSLPYCTYQ